MDKKGPGSLRGHPPFIDLTLMPRRGAERTKDNAFQTSRLRVQSRTGHSADKGSADSSGQSHQGKARLIGIQLRGKLWMGAWDVFACFGGPLQASPPTGR